MLPKISNLFRLGKNPQLINTQSGKTICKLSLACSEKYGETKTDLWLDGVAFGRGGEVIDQHFAKGDLIFLFGKLSPNNYQKEDGTMHYGFQMIIESFEFVGSKNKPQDSHNESKSNGYQPQQESLDIDDSDIPF